jgi:hypothetical protein
VTEKKLDSFFQVLNAEKHQKKKIKIEANMKTHAVRIDIV